MNKDNNKRKVSYKTPFAAYYYKDHFGYYYMKNRKYNESIILLALEIKNNKISNQGHQMIEL